MGTAGSCESGGTYPKDFGTYEVKVDPTLSDSGYTITKLKICNTGGTTPCNTINGNISQYSVTLSSTNPKKTVTFTYAYSGGVGIGICAPTHYNCQSLNGSADHRNLPSRVTWTCLGSNPDVETDDDKTCSEQKGPGFIED